MDASEYRPPLFAVKKWTLVGFCSVYVFLEIVLAAFAGKIADAWIEEFKHEKDYHTFNDIESARVSVQHQQQQQSVIPILKDPYLLSTTFRN